MLYVYAKEQCLIVTSVADLHPPAICGKVSLLLKVGDIVDKVVHTTGQCLIRLHAQ